MSDSLLESMADLAVKLARDGAELARAGLDADSVHRKADNSVVTATDHAIQAHVLAAIAQAFPEHAVWAEETVETPQAHADRCTARYCWVIDPLDGTRNFSLGFPCHATSIAVLDRGEPVVGVICEHNLRSLYSAIRGGGASMDGRPLRMKTWADDEDVLIGVPSSKDELTRRVVAGWTATRGLILRNLGSTAFQLALVGSGCMGATFCKRCRAWDIAAGALLVTEAGGRITDPFGAPCLPFDLDGDPEVDTPFLAGAPEVHDRLAKSIRSMIA